jgi:hypothetical protein
LHHRDRPVQQLDLKHLFAFASSFARTSFGAALKVPSALPFE